MSLRRVLTTTDAAWLVAGNMIGAGIFFTPGAVAGQLPGMAFPLLAWVAGGVLALDQVTKAWAEATLPGNPIVVNFAPQWSLIQRSALVICAGGGGIPTAYDDEKKLYGVEAVIDKDLASGLLAQGLDADMFVMLTDVSHIYRDFGTEAQRAIRRAHPDALEALDFAAGSMGPKVMAACEFVRETGCQSAIGRLSELSMIMNGKAGTLISPEAQAVEYFD